MRTGCALCKMHDETGLDLASGGWKNRGKVLKPNEFKNWRKSLDLSQKDAAHALGLKRRVVQYYEKGERDGKKIEIPLYIRLACAAYAAGIRDYDGPPKGRTPHNPALETEEAVTPPPDPE